MVTSNQITPGMILSISGKLFRVESAVRVSLAKAAAFMKCKLRDLSDETEIEKNFKMNQEVNDVTLSEESLEYLYAEGKEHLFLDTRELDQVSVSSDVIGDKIRYLKEGVQVNASFYGETIHAIELPPFLELMVIEVDGEGDSVAAANVTTVATLETGATVEVPGFVAVGDIIKVDTRTGDYIQRI
ncbi:MAG: elongation factor P [Waddliaceae bacterium]|nr:elongation factor P [Waddliaceae bacterium]